LRANKSTISAPGEAVVLSWKTINGVSASINNGVGAVSPVGEGSITVNPTGDTTYTLTVNGIIGQADCETSITIGDTQPAARCVAFAASHEQITPGQAVTLTWETENATRASINQNIGQVALSGSMTVNPTQTTTYILTVEGVNGPVDCQDTVVVDDGPPPSGPRCIYLRASDTTIEEGQEITLTWETERASRVELNQGIGRVAADGSREVSPDEDTTYVLSVYDDEDGEAADLIDTCQVSVSLDDDDDDDGGGGGGGGSRRPRVVLDVDTIEPEPPLSFVYLSEMPYTGLDLGPMGTAVYWLMLIGWSAAAAYLTLFHIMPFALRRVRTFGTDVHGVLNSDHAPEAHEETVMHSASHAVPAAHPPASHAPAHADASHFRGYTSKEGFRSFAQTDTLTIDDIVKGLSRESAQAPVHQEPVVQASVYQAPIAQAQIEPVIVPNTERIQEQTAAQMEIHHDVPAFIQALLAGDRDTVFGMLRQVNRTGGDSETFVTHAVCALDDAYRARLEGTPCHPEILRATEDCATPFLEKVIVSLATAVDSSYSTGVTGAKLALTRALSVVNG